MLSRGPGEKRWRAPEGRDRSVRSTLVALVLASVTLVVLDHQGGDSSPVDPVRDVAGSIVGPVEKVTASAVRPFAAIGDTVRTRGDLRDEVDALRSDNAALKAQVATQDYDRERLAEFEGLTRAASDLGRTLVPARVIGFGPAQSFSSTVTIDAGSDAGLRPDMTVLNDDGLVGRVLRVNRTTSTVLLIVDPESVVGARIGESREVGFLKGRGVLGRDGRLDLELLDPKHVPAQGDQVLSWGSDGAGPYVAGVPVGRVTEVYSSVREQSHRAVIEPVVDFSSLDVVGVVVPGDTTSDRAVVRSDGGIG